jgi:peptidyl-prolyl cis-trans isomerase D
MIGGFRYFLGTWAAKAFFLVLIGVFVLWGVGTDALRLLSEDGAVAIVGGKRIEIPEANDAYRRQLDQVTRMLGTTVNPTPEIRRGVAAQALEGLITQTAMNVAVANMGLAVPDEALRQAVFDMPAFRGPDGKFSRDTLTQVLRNNNFSEPRFLDLMRAEMGQRQLTGAARAGIVSPDVLTGYVFAFSQEQRVAEAVGLAFSTAPTPEQPTDAQLARWYENNKALYSTKEYRRIHAVLLTPEGAARDTAIEEADLRGAYDARAGSLTKPERRSVQVILTQEQDKAMALATIWGSGADWAAMQERAKEEGGAPVELTDATREEIPAEELAQAIFTAPEGTVPPPVRSALGWHVLRVTAVHPATGASFEESKEDLRASLIADRAVDLVYGNANKLEDLLAGGAKLEELPGDLGLLAISGTLDAQGLTVDGGAAPIPGDEALRRAVVAEAFRQGQGAPARLSEVPRTQGAAIGFFAVEVDEIFPPEPRPYADVALIVRDDFIRDAIRRSRDAAAAGLLAAVKAGKTLAEAAAEAGLTAAPLPPVSRTSPAAGVPPQLIEPLFALKKGEATMIETPDGFLVAVLAEIREVDPKADPLTWGRIRDAVAKGLGDDLQASITFALRDRAKPQVNRKLADSIAQPE